MIFVSFFALVLALLLDQTTLPSGDDQ